MTMINDTLKQAVIESGVSHYRISKETGINRRAIDRFIHGGRGSNIGINTAAILADYLGLELKPKKDTRK